MKTKLLILPLLVIMVFTCDLDNTGNSYESTSEYNLTNDYKADVRASQSAVILYAKAKYKGKKLKLSVGNHSQGYLINHGFKNDDAESIKVKKGYAAKLYDRPDFLDYSETITKNKKRLSKKIRNKVSSISVYKISTDDDDDDDNNNDDDNDNNDDNDDDNDCKRIGLSCDGNAHDTDDIGASAFSVAIIAAYRQKLVHFDYSSHLGKVGRDAEMRASVEGAARKFFNDTSMTFSSQTDLDGAIANGVRQINMSSEGDYFYYGCSGPMEVPWRIVNASLPEKRQYCTVFSHSGWNNKHQDKTCSEGGKGMTHIWSDLQKSGVRSVNVSMPSSGVFKMKPGDWDPLHNINHAGVNWLPSRVENARDITDATLAWYICTGADDAVCSGGDYRGTVAKVLTLFESVWGLK